MGGVREASFATLALALLVGCSSADEPTDAVTEVPLTAPRPVSVESVVVADSPPVAPFVLDVVPTDVTVRRVVAGPTEAVSPEIDPRAGAATLYGEPESSNSPARRLLLVGSSSGSAMIGGPRIDAPGAHPVRVAGGDGDATFVPTFVPGEDRAWVVVSLGQDSVGYVVGQGLTERELIAAAEHADYLGTPPAVAPAGLPTSLRPIVAGQPGDGPRPWRGQQIELIVDQVLVHVSVVHADPDLVTLWGFWAVNDEPLDLPPVDGAGRRAGLLPGTIIGDEAYGVVWAQDGHVVSVVGVPWQLSAREPAHVAEAVDRIAEQVRPGTAEELAALAQRVLRQPTLVDLQCPAGAPIISGRTGEITWAYAAGPDPAWDGALHQCAGVTNPVDGLRTQDEIANSALPSVGQLIPGAAAGEQVLDRLEHSGSLRTGIAPPGTVRVIVTAPDLTVREAVLAPAGPRPGERLFAAYFPGYWYDLVQDRAFTAAAFDANGALIDDAVLP